MFDSLSDRLGGVFDRLRGRGALTEADVRAAMREVRIALLEVGHRRLGEARLDAHHRPRSGRGRVGRVAGEHEHALDVLGVLRAQRDRRLVGARVVVAVGQAEA